jgi:hypothetical protein
MRVYAAVFALCTVAALLTSEPCCGSSEYKQAATASGQSPTPAVGTKKNYPEATNETETTHNGPPSWCTALKRPEWWLVIVAILTGLAIAYQAREMRRATEAMGVQAGHMQGQLCAMNQQRDLMSRQLTEMGNQTSAMWEQIKTTFAEKIPRLKADIVQEPPELKPVEVFPTVAITVTNEGSTNAFNVFAEGAATLHESDSFPQDAKIWPLTIPQTIEPRAEFKVLIHFTPLLTEEDINNVRWSKAFLHIFGIVKYQNFLNHPAEAYFWYVWRVSHLFDFMIVDGIPNPDFSRWETHIHPEAQRMIREYEEQHRKAN